MTDLSALAPEELADRALVAEGHERGPLLDELVARANEFQNALDAFNASCRETDKFEARAEAAEARLAIAKEALVRIAGTPTKNSCEEAHACARGAMEALDAIHKKP